MVGRSIVTLGTGIITYSGTKGTLGCYVADAALFSQHGVSCGKGPAAVNLLAICALDHEPSHGDNWNQDGQPESPASKRMRTGEVLQIHPLGQVLGCAYAPRHRFS